MGWENKRIPGICIYTRAQVAKTSFDENLHLTVDVLVFFIIYSKPLFGVDTLTNIIDWKHYSYNSFILSPADPTPFIVGGDVDNLAAHTYSIPGISL